MPVGDEGGQLGTGLVALLGKPKRATNPVPTGTPTPNPLLSTFPVDAILMKIYECKAGRL